jgi:hypothetical protein
VPLSIGPLARRARPVKGLNKVPAEALRMKKAGAAVGAGSKMVEVIQPVIMSLA